MTPTASHRKILTPNPTRRGRMNRILIGVMTKRRCKGVRPWANITKPGETWYTHPAHAELI